LHLIHHGLKQVIHLLSIHLPLAVGHLRQVDLQALLLLAVVPAVVVVHRGQVPHCLLALAFQAAVPEVAVVPGVLPHPVHHRLYRQVAVEAPHHYLPLAVDHLHQVGVRVQAVAVPV